MYQSIPRLEVSFSFFFFFLSFDFLFFFDRTKKHHAIDDRHNFFKLFSRETVMFLDGIDC